ncbi:uncharacterized protein LOC124471310 isoform X3 [Hypomesus transpacificus]|uniref:uncharacterized protein LOC124471310 isoform X3 n=1 Tax=Hypomesus transpacificus TaxID=137520 RepID=UPI001F082056|nr:uncharacterized protein LOC124471310 isoform X3 [Hypomesus transpacificus]
MAELEVFREFIKERLSIEALQIFGAVENTFSECKDDGARLDVKPEINLHFTDVQQLSFPETPQIKEEQVLWTSQEEEQLQGLQSETADSILTQESEFYNVRMSKLQLFLSDKLTTAALEIFIKVEKKFAEYEGEIMRLQSLLDIVTQPKIKLHRIGPLKLHQVVTVRLGSLSCWKMTLLPSLRSRVLWSKFSSRICLYITGFIFPSLPVPAAEKHLHSTRPSTPSGQVAGGKMFLIVEFVEEKNTGPVANSWYTNGLAWWPPYQDQTRILKSIKKAEVPQPEKGWTRHQARVLYETDSFENIVCRWKQSCYTSDIQSDCEIAKRERKRKSYSSSEEEARDSRPPCLDPPKKLSSAQTPPSPPQLERNDLATLQDWAATPSNTQYNPQPGIWGQTPTPHVVKEFSTRENTQQGWPRYPTTQCTPFERVLQEAIREMDIRIGHLTSMVESLVQGRHRGQPQQEDDCFQIPLMDTEALDSFEEHLQSSENRKKMINVLSQSGGQTIKKTVWRIAQKVFANVLAKQLNWCGRGDKRGLKASRCAAVIIGAAMRNHMVHATEAEAEKCLRDFLRLASGRK